MQTDDNTPGEDTEDAQGDADAAEAPEHNAELVEPEDGAEDDGDQGADLFMGEPFAMAGVDGEEGNVQFLDANPASQVPGCFASVLCSCGQPFKLNLLPAEDAGLQCCPGCETEYTSVLVVGAMDDGQIWTHTMMHVFQVNGMAPEGNPEDEDDGDEDDSNGTGIPDATTKE